VAVGAYAACMSCACALLQGARCLNGSVSVCVCVCVCVQSVCVSREPHVQQLQGVQIMQPPCAAWAAMHNNGNIVVACGGRSARLRVER
jgi:hypothetical protein